MNSSAEQFKYDVIALNEVDSTNAYLFNLYRNDNNISEFLTVSAGYQFKGRGQRTSQGWESNRGENLLFSFLIKPRSVAIKDQFIISQMIALAIKEELDTFSDGFKIKWPNDIYWHDKKIAGILIETELKGSTFDVAIIGVGLNLLQTIFYGDAPNPISLIQITDKEINQNELMDNILIRFQSYYKSYNKHQNGLNIYQRYLKSIYRLKVRATYNDKNGDFIGRIIGVDKYGFLLLEDDQLSIRKYAFKEVRYKI